LDRAAWVDGRVEGCDTEVERAGVVFNGDDGRVVCGADRLHVAEQQRLLADGWVVRVGEVVVRRVRPLCRLGDVVVDAGTGDDGEEEYGDDDPDGSVYE
jgi:hypothetical protein